MAQRYFNEKVEWRAHRLVLEARSRGYSDVGRILIRRDGMAGRDPPYKLTVLHGGASRAPAAEFDGELALAPMAEEDCANELRLERIRAHGVRAKKATAGRNAATSR